MSNITLKQAIKNKNESINLTQEQLDKLIHLQESTPKKEKIINLVPQQFKKYFAITSTLIIVSILGIFFLINKPYISENISTEVASNHLKLKPLEINSDKLLDLNNYFTQLEFRLVNTNIMQNPDWELLGARYCSIQGITAAQLRLKNKKTGVIETLYQAPYDKNLFGYIPALEKNQTPIEKTSKGISVKIWVEKGILFTLTNSQL